MTTEQIKMVDEKKMMRDRIQCTGPRGHRSVQNPGRKLLSESMTQVPMEQVLV